MNRILTALFLCFILIDINAQRIDLDKSYFDYTYRRLPNIVLDKSFTTYSVEIFKSVALDAYSNESANSIINIDGRQKVQSNGHFIVKADLKDLIIEGSEVIERVEVHKDKDGKETGRSYYYHVRVTYSFEASGSVRDYKNASMSSYLLATRDSKSIYRSTEYPKRADAANFYNNNSLEIITSLVSEQITKAMKFFNDLLNSDFGYATTTERGILWTLGSKKHPEYAMFQQNVDAAKSSLSLLAANEMPEQVYDDLKAIIEYFAAIPGRFSNTEEKGEAKLRYAAYYNLAELFLLTEKVDKAKEYAQKLVDNAFDPKDGEKIIKEADALAADFEKHQMVTRHFKPDLDNIQPPM